jgi:hypothetical protein
MKITAELLQGLGAEILNDAGTWKGCYTLFVHGYNFKFRKYYDEPTNSWLFIIDDDTSHVVTDLEECFGIIAKQFHVWGKEDCKEEFRTWLNSE